jgi:hypothetical protein
MACSIQSRVLIECQGRKKGVRRYSRQQVHKPCICRASQQAYLQAVLLSLGTRKGVGELSRRRANHNAEWRTADNTTVHIGPRSAHGTVHKDVLLLVPPIRVCSRQ